MKIQVPSSNIFEEKRKAFSKSRLAERIAKKFEPKPYEEKRRGLYVVAWVGSIFCNLVAVIMGSTFVFTYVLGLVAKFPYPIVLAGIVAGVILFGIEVLKQLLTPDLFQELNQYRRANHLQIVGMIGLVCVSTLFNYFGGFDFTETVMKKPVKEAVQLQSVQEIREQYQPQISQAGEVAEQYRKSKIWDSRLSDDNAKVYQRLLSKKQGIEEEMNQKITRSEESNQKAIERAENKHQESLKTWGDQVAHKGRGLAGFSVFCELLFVLCCWYRERYEFKVAIQYAEDEAESEKKTTSSEKTEIKMKQVNGFGLNGHKGHNGTAQTQRTPIGFFTERQRQEQAEQTQEHTREKIVFTTSYEDTHTIEHNGKRYRLVDVNRFVRTYKDRHSQAVRTARKQQDEEKKERWLRIEKTREDKLNYWKQRQEELLEKSKNASQFV